MSRASASASSATVGRTCLDCKANFWPGEPEVHNDDCFSPEVVEQPPEPPRPRAPKSSPRSSPSAGSEAAVLRSCLVWLSQQPRTFCWRNNVGFAIDPRSGRAVRFGIPGAADILACVRGRAVAVETKSARGRQSPEQLVFQRAWERGGGIYVLARSLQDLQLALAPLLSA